MVSIWIVGLSAQESWWWSLEVDSGRIMKKKRASPMRCRLLPSFPSMDVFLLTKSSDPPDRGLCARVVFCVIAFFSGLFFLSSPSTPPGSHQITLRDTIKTLPSHWMIDTEIPHPPSAEKTSG